MPASFFTRLFWRPKILVPAIASTETMTSAPSQGYKLGYSEAIINALQQRTAADDAAHLLPYLKPTSKVLDIGCGPGSISISFARIATNGCVIGVDISTVSLTIAEKHADRARAEAASRPGQLGELMFMELDVFQGLPFEDSSFDVVYSGQTFVHLLAGEEGMARATKVMREIRRVLKPGGVVATRDVCGYHWFPSSYTVGKEKLFEMMMKAIMGVAKPLGGDVPGIYRKAGFDIDKTTISSSTRVISGREKREWLGRIALQRAEGPGHREKFLREGYTEAQLEEVKALLHNWMDDEDAWQTGVHTDVLAFK